MRRRLIPKQSSPTLCATEEQPDRYFVVLATVHTFVMDGIDIDMTLYRLTAARAYEKANGLYRYHPAAFPALTATLIKEAYLTRRYCDGHGKPRAWRSMVCGTPTLRCPRSVQIQTSLALSRLRVLTSHYRLSAVLLWS